MKQTVSIGFHSVLLTWKDVRDTWSLRRSPSVIPWHLACYTSVGVWTGLLYTVDICVCTVVFICVCVCVCMCMCVRENAFVLHK